MKTLPLALKLGDAALLTCTLTACPGPYRYDPPQARLTFSLPSSTETLTLAALYYTNEKGVYTPHVVAKGYAGSRGSIELYKADLNKIDLANCLSYRADLPRTEVNMSPTTGKICDISFVAYAGSEPTLANLRYLTHDTYSYANEKLSYSFKVSGSGMTATEKGERIAGWTLVRHLVTNPASTPTQYLVTRNSADDSSMNLALKMHEPSDPLTSMSLRPHTRSQVMNRPFRPVRFAPAAGRLRSTGNRQHRRPASPAYRHQGVFPGCTDGHLPDPQYGW